MLGVDEVHVQSVFKAKKLPMIKMIIFSENEQLWYDIIKVATGSGFECSYHEINETHTNRWTKLYNGLWDNNSGVFIGCEPHDGSKRILCT